jgi:hypothetical protein
MINILIFTGLVFIVLTVFKVWVNSRKTERQRIIENWMAQGGDLAEELFGLRHENVKNIQEAAAVVNAVATFSFKGKTEKTDADSSFRALLDLMRKPGSKQVFSIFVNKGFPELRRLLSEGMVFPRNREDDLMITISTLSEVSDEEDISRIATVVKNNFCPDSICWFDIFENIAGCEKSLKSLISKLKDNLPDGNIGSYFLLNINKQMLDKKLHRHPYSSEQGYSILKGYLEREEETSYSAAVALAFISDKYSKNLFKTALKHENRHVKLEAGWAAAKRGNPAGVRLLRGLTFDVHSSRTACRYLEELGLKNAIPAKINSNLDFRAMAEMSYWLQHPHKYGDAPHEIEVVDKRKLYWPPAKGHIPVWLFRYTYHPEKGFRDEHRTGTGMVGSITFELFHEDKHKWSPEQIYGLHCAWEMGLKGGWEAGFKELKKRNKLDHSHMRLLQQ